MFELLPVDKKGLLAFKVSGKLTEADYRQFLPVLEGLIRESGRLSLYIELADFEGWEAKAACCSRRPAMC
jgi:SpoIIAA-like